MTATGMREMAAGIIAMVERMMTLCGRQDTV